MECPHEYVERFESLSPRIPVLVWRCTRCYWKFEPARPPTAGAFRTWLAVRRARRELSNI